jgi:hypothetical protein
MPMSEVTFLEAEASLEAALEARPDPEPRRWAARVDHALATIASALARHGRCLRDDGGALLELFGGQAPSPGMNRQVKRLRLEVAELQQVTEALQSRVREILSSRDERGPIGKVKEQAAHLLAALDRYFQKEAHVILVSTTTEVGAGD